MNDHFKADSDCWRRFASKRLKKAFPSLPFRLPSQYENWRHLVKCRFNSDYAVRLPIVGGGVRKDPLEDGRLDHLGSGSVRFSRHRSTASAYTFFSDWLIDPWTMAHYVLIESYGGTPAEILPPHAAMILLNRENYMLRAPHRMQLSGSGPPSHVHVVEKEPFVTRNGNQSFRSRIWLRFECVPDFLRFRPEEITLPQFVLHPGKHSPSDPVLTSAQAWYEFTDATMAGQTANGVDPISLMAIINAKMNFVRWDELYGAERLSEIRTADRSLSPAFLTVAKSAGRTLARQDDLDGVTFEVNSTRVPISADEIVGVTPTAFLDQFAVTSVFNGAADSMKSSMNSGTNQSFNSSSTADAFALSGSRRLIPIGRFVVCSKDEILEDEQDTEQEKEEQERDLLKRAWFSIQKRVIVERELGDRPPGSFVVRYSSDPSIPYVLSVFKGRDPSLFQATGFKEFVHYPILLEPRKKDSELLEFTIDRVHYFPTIVELLKGCFSFVSLRLSDYDDLK